MAAWPRNVVKEHRCAAWLLYLFLISLFITYASVTINHNLQRRDHPLVVEDVVEEAWTLPDIVVCSLHRWIIRVGNAFVVIIIYLMTTTVSRCDARLRCEGNVTVAKIHPCRFT